MWPLRPRRAISTRAATGASTPRDMGKVMNVLKERYAGQLDFGKVGALVKAKLG